MPVELKTEKCKRKNNSDVKRLDYYSHQLPLMFTTETEKKFCETGPHTVRTA